MALIKCPSCGKTISDTDDCRYCGLSKSEFSKRTYAEPEPEAPPEPEAEAANTEAGPKTVIMIRCRKCGKAIPEDAAFCQYCGEPAYSKEPVQSQETPLPFTGLRLVLSVILIVVAAFVSFQSILVMAIDATSGGVGIGLAMVMLICGILGIVTRKDTTGKFPWGIGCFLVAFGILAVTTRSKTYPDLAIWGVLSIASGLVFCASKLMMKK